MQNLTIFFGMHMISQKKVKNDKAKIKNIS